jgi:hypothetical protein
MLHQTSNNPRLQENLGFAHNYIRGGQWGIIAGASIVAGPWGAMNAFDSADDLDALMCYAGGSVDCSPDEGAQQAGLKGGLVRRLALLR